MEGTIEQLLGVDPRCLSRDEQFDHLAALHRLAARVSARTQRALAAVADPDDEKDWVREEVACLLRWSFGYTQSRLAQAEKLVDALPATLDALETGTIGPEHARAVAEGAYGLDAVTCAKLETRLLERAATQTVTDLRRSITRALHVIDPRCGEEARDCEEGS